MDDKNLPTPETVIQAANGNRPIPSISDVVTHWQNGFATGYEKFVLLAGGFVTLVFCIGCVIAVIGFVSNSSNLKRWGMASMFGPLACFGLILLAPLLVAFVKTKFLPS